MSKENGGSADEANVDHSHDGVFFTTFSLVLGFLVALTLVIIGIANVVVDDDNVDPLKTEQVAERIAPVGKVYTDASQQQAPVAEVAADEAPAKSGADIVTASCAACHMAGVMNAPKMDATADWQVRLDAAGGLEGLVSSAIGGKGGMPPRGGAALSDDEVSAAVLALLEGAGVSAE